MSHLDQARAIVEHLRSAFVDPAASHLANLCAEDGSISVTRMDEHQTVLYDFASLASSVAAAEELLTYGEQGDEEAALAHAFAADVAADVAGRLAGREDTFADDLPLDLDDEGVRSAVAAGRDPDFLSEIAGRVLQSGRPGPLHISEEREMIRDTFRRFADEQVKPVAEEVHREDRDIPDAIIDGLSELGTFGMSVPAEYGGMAAGEADDLLNMVLVTDELSRGSLGVAGSLITRPEIITTAILEGGTEEQKKRWLPAIASGEKMCAVAVTEPDFGSDVAMLKTTASRDGDEWVVNGVKTWCTFAGKAEYLLLLARTDPDRSKAHRGLSMFVVEKPSHDGHEFRVEQDRADGRGSRADGRGSRADGRGSRADGRGSRADGRGSNGGVIDARAISTIGYRGMHSFEISFEDWRVPHDNLIGLDDGLGQGFYYQMKAFASGRLQTAARANGLMQAALEDAVAYSQQRQVFGTALGEYGLSRTKIARMAFLLAACRQMTLKCAGQLASGEGQLEASMVKQLACRVAEWVTREAQQLHGGYGYAEEFAVSRYFVDARVLSIFEGADEVLALRVIARSLLRDALDD